MNAVIGALRVVLGADTAAWEEGLKKAQTELRKASRQFERVGGEIQRAGQAITLGLSAPIAAFGALTVKTAGDFEASMNRVGIATQATTKELGKLEALARDIGKNTTFSASQAAGAMEELAKNGLSTAQILDGAARASVDLAAATGSELEPAAAAVTDTMTVFHKTAGQLPGVVDQITGAVNKSKFDFADFQDGMAQAGARAAGLGVSFEDFNAVLAGTASQFSSGSDAGTSFGSFIQRLNPQSKEAAEAVKALGLEFYTASGQLRPMGEVAEELRTKLGGLSDAKLNEALTKIFGADSIRTALGLMQLGAKGLAEVRTEIEKTNAASQAAKRMAGFNGQLEQLKGSLEELAIAIGKSGLLEGVTKAVTAFAGLVDKMSGLPKPILAVGTSVAILAAAIGPAVLTAGAFTASVGVITRALAGFTLSAGAATGAMAALRTAMAFITGPWGIAIAAIATAMALLAREIWGAKTASAEMEKATRGVDAALGEYEEAARIAAVATGKDKDAALEAVKAKRFLAQEAIRAAKAEMAHAEATLANLDAYVKARNAQDRYSSRGDAAGSIAGANPFVIGARRQAEADIAAGRAALDQASKRLAAINSSLAAPVVLGGGGGGGNNTIDLGGGSSSKGKSAEDLAAMRATLDLENQIALARAKGLEDVAQYLEDRLELARLTKQFEDAGVKDAAAKAEAHVKALQAAREQQEMLAFQAAVEAGLREKAAYWAEHQVQQELEIARLAGDSAKVRELERELDLRRRIAEYKAQGKSEADALAIASGEQSAADEAEMQGKFREAFRGGFKAALEGGDFFQRWIADQATRGLEEALNSLADTLLAMFKNIDWGSFGRGGGSSGGGGGWLSAAASAVGSMFDGVPGFATGGSFKVGGRAGIDRNLVQFRATRGEMVDIRKPGQERAGGSVTVVNNTGVQAAARVTRDDNGGTRIDLRPMFRDGVRGAGRSGDLMKGLRETPPKKLRG